MSGRVTLLLLALGSAALLAAMAFLLRPTDISSALQRGDYQFAANQMERTRLDGDFDGNSLILVTLANLYYVGLGVRQSFSRSTPLYSEAAFAGNVSAQINMGHVYANGHGVETDGEMAYAWFNIARTNGSKIAQLYMSELLAERKMRHHMVNQVRTEFATLKSFPRLH